MWEFFLWLIKPAAISSKVDKLWHKNCRPAAALVALPPHSVEFSFQEISFLLFLRGLRSCLPPPCVRKVIFLLLFILNIYLFIHSERAKREAETQAEGEAGSMQGARRGTRSWDSRITPRAAGGTKPLCHRGCPRKVILFWTSFHHFQPLWTAKPIFPLPILKTKAMSYVSSWRTCFWNLT